MLQRYYSQDAVTVVKLCMSQNFLFSFSFFEVELTNKIVVYLKCANMVIFTYVPILKISTIWLTFIIFTFLRVRTLKFYSLSKFQLYSSVLSTIVSMLHLRSSDIIHLTTESTYAFTSYFLFPPTPTHLSHWQPPFYSLFI